MQLGVHAHIQFAGKRFRRSTPCFLTIIEIIIDGFVEGTLQLFDRRSFKEHIVFCIGQVAMKNIISFVESDDRRVPFVSHDLPLNLVLSRAP